tara:strand:- start:268 stop:1389 length:1122 start_codon:yes stop_codon:yes gene_type:complete
MIKKLSIFFILLVTLTVDVYSILIDVRTREEWDMGFIEGATHIPLNNLESKIDKFVINNKEEILLYCRRGNRSGKAKLLLDNLGYTNVKNLGGIYDVNQNLNLNIINPNFLFGSVDDHLNLVISSYNKKFVENFYGNILNLERISDIQLPENRLMLRYIAGESELKFIVDKKNEFLINNKPNKFNGITKLTLYFPMEKKDDVLNKLKENQLEIINYSENIINNIKTIEIDLFDFERNAIELVFMKEELKYYRYNYSKINVNVSDLSEADNYFNKILGLERINQQNQNIYKMGKTLIDVNNNINLKSNYVGMPNEIIGMSLIQFVVKDIPSSREEILKRGGKIFIEPYNIGDMAIIMFTQGPNGILFEFGAALN